MRKKLVFFCKKTYWLVRKNLLVLLNYDYRNKINFSSRYAGSEYGGFYYHPDLIDQGSIILSFGLGEDVTFDLELNRIHKCVIHGFDPTPKSIYYLKNQVDLPENYVFHDYGIGAVTNLSKKFYLPVNDNYVSGSVNLISNVDELNYIEVKIMSLTDIIYELELLKIDILKLDIEGSEFEIIDSIIANRDKIIQLIVEFHPRFFADGYKLLKIALRKLEKNDFLLFKSSLSLNEFSFVNKSFI